jgi:spore coat polysaccharide biosynthesis protein SpsF (cytidylyltransferase family)
MNVVCIIQARLGSTRLPRKALADLCGKPLIRHVADRAKQIRGVDRWVIAVPSHADYQAIMAVSGPGGVEIAFADVDENDVLGRYAACAKTFDASVIMRLTGDCPLLNPTIAEDVLRLFWQTPDCEYASNIAPGYVDGEDVEVFTAEALARAHETADDPSDREHVTPIIRRTLQIRTLLPSQAIAGRKTSVDTLSDLERVRALMAFQ